MNANPAEQTGADAMSTAELLRIRHLAALFAREPELVQACLQGIESESPDEAHVVLEAARMAAVLHPTYADLLYYAAKAAVMAHEYETADRLLDSALALNPEYKDALILAGRVALLRAQPQRAATLLETALAGGADYPDVHVLLGSVWEMRGELEQARASYTRALELNDSLESAQQALATLSLQTMVREQV
jgi:superkiller protein 3